MPRDFIECVRKAKEGKARVKRIVGPSKKHGLKAGEYVNVCFSGGNMYRGEVHKKAK